MFPDTLPDRRSWPAHRWKQQYGLAVGSPQARKMLVKCDMRLAQSRGGDPAENNQSGAVWQNQDCGPPAAPIHSRLHAEWIASQRDCRRQKSL